MSEERFEIEESGVAAAPEEPSEEIKLEESFEEMLETRGYIVYTNVGHSMMPLLRERRLFVFRTISKKRFQVPEILSESFVFLFIISVNLPYFGMNTFLRRTAAFRNNRNDTTNKNEKIRKMMHKL